MISARVVGAAEAARAFITTASVVQARTAGVVAYHGKKYQAAVKRRASGRPGPNVITGKYRNSIQFRMIRGGTTAAAAIGSDHPASHRLENGFFGSDSLGRNYHQEPRPHYEPDLQATADELQRSVAAMVVIDSTAINTVSFS